MMKTKLLLSLAIFSSLLTHLCAQVSIYNSHYFKAGLQVQYQPTFDSLIVSEDVGPDQIWDYSDIPTNGASYSREIKPSSATNYGYKFQNANMAIVGENNDHVYLNVQEDKTEFIGFVPPDSSYLVHNYLPWSLSIHPMHYGDSLKSPVGRHIEIEDRKVYRVGTVLLAAIGSGSLHLPNKTYQNVLKVKEVQTFFNPSRTTFYQATTYHWLSNECNFPILSCNEIIDRNSKGEEQITRFAQYLVSEENTRVNVSVKEILDQVDAAMGKK